MSEKIELKPGELASQAVSLNLLNGRILILSHTISSLEVFAQPRAMHTIQYTVEGGPAIILCYTSSREVAKGCFDRFKAGPKGFLEQIEE